MTLRAPAQHSPLFEGLPAEILEAADGIDPTPLVRARDVVLDLGCGSGKTCFAASQLTGPGGRVIGVEATPERLALARRHEDAIGRAIGWYNVELHCADVRDLALDLEALAHWVEQHPARGRAGDAALRRAAARLRREVPMVAGSSVDLVLSGDVQDLASGRDEKRLFAEIRRVLKPGGRWAVSGAVAWTKG